jgi:hypothetical protein
MKIDGTNDHRRTSPFRTSRIAAARTLSIRERAIGSVGAGREVSPNLVYVLNSFIEVTKVCYFHPKVNGYEHQSYPDGQGAEEKIVLGGPRLHPPFQVHWTPPRL